MPQLGDQEGLCQRGHALAIGEDLRQLRPTCSHPAGLLRKQLVGLRRPQYTRRAPVIGIGLPPERRTAKQKGAGAKAWAKTLRLWKRMYSAKSTGVTSFPMAAMSCFRSRHST
mmetsp:Transcript_64171/g.198696  ORF Transcript_64171/g.198696 Transcript_64171/m.198696 type:complete len:113 (-) Transcript_64171:198-536(-)